MTRQLGLPLAAGLLSAVLFLSLVKGFASGALLSYFAPLPLAMAGLGLGRAGAFLAAAVMVAATAVVAGPFAALPASVGVAMPALLASDRALFRRLGGDGAEHWYPPGHVLAWLTAAGLALMLTGMAFLIGRPEGIQGFVAEAIGQALNLIANDLPEETRKQVVQWWTPLFPAMIIGSWLVMGVVNVIGAQALLARAGQARRPTPPYRELMLPDWLGLGLVVSVVLAVLARGDVGYIATNVLVVLMIPFVFLGLAGIHRWALGRPNARLVLVATYVLLFLAIGWAAAAAAGLGLVRFWTMRFRRHDSGGGMEG